MAATKLSTLALIVALIASFLIVLVELGTSLDAIVESLLGLGDRFAELGSSFAGLTGEGDSSSGPPIGDFKSLEGMLSNESEDLPGMAVASLLPLDLLLMTTVLLFVLPLILSPRALAMVQGILGVVLGIVAIVMAFITILKALVNIFLMLGLLLAIPFGTIVYMVLYASFETGEAAAILSSLMLLKIVLSIAIVVAHERFLINLGFVALVATSFVAMIIISFLHNFPPTFLVSITDSVAALVVSIVVIIWGILYIIGGIIGIVSMLKGLVL